MRDLKKKSGRKDIRNGEEGNRRERKIVERAFWGEDGEGGYGISYIYMGEVEDVPSRKRECELVEIVK